MITWTTNNDLGVVSEDFNTSITIAAINSNPSAIVYTLINGQIPYGLTLTKTGAISGRAQNTTVNSNYKFTVRATAVDGGVTVINDRTFLMQVQGEHVPVINTTTKDLGNVFTGEYFIFKFRAVDLDTEDTVKFYINSGRLPVGLSLAPDGTLSGTVAPIISVASRSYSFRVAATDSKNTVYAPYQLTVLNRSANTADTRSYLASNTTVRTDAGVQLVPVILNTESDLGIHRSDDRYSHQITAVSFDKSPVVFRIASGPPPTINLITSHSDAFDGGSWTGYCGSTSNVTFNTTDITAPNGTFTAAKIVRDSNAVCGSGSVWGLIWGLGNVTVGVTYTISMWVRAPIAVNGCLFGFNDVWGGFFNISTTWQRVTYTGVLADPGNGLRGFQFTMPAGSGTAYFWGAQLEANSFATPYTSLPTAATPDTSAGSLPPNLTLHPTTGWIEGYLPGHLPPGLKTYTFSIIATSVATNLTSIAKTFTITIDSSGVSQASGWNIGPNLGRMRLGDVSILDINPHTDDTVTFRLQAGNSLPPNLQLKENGLIVGRLAFDRVLDREDVSINYKFAVDMFNNLGTVIATKIFDLDIDYQAPYETLYLQVFPKQSHRNLYFSILQNTDIIPTDKVYRISDSYFSITKQLKMLAITGLTPDVAANYIANSSLNHRRKQSYIQEINWAVAKDRNSKAVYEVVYGVLKDREENEDGITAPVVKKLSISSQADITADNSLTNVSTGIFSTNVGTSITAGQQVGIKSYPPSYSNMRSQVYSKTTLSSTSALPFWLSTLQESGETLADHNVIPLVYVKLGQGASVVANIVNAGIDFSTIPFDIDGYVWENYQYVGPELTNKLTGITPVSIFIANNYLATTNSETAQIPSLGNIFVNYISIQNNYPTSGLCCPNLYTYGNVDVSGSTLYTYAIVYKVASGYTHPNFMYRYEYNGSTFLYEVGVHDNAKRVHLGDGWYWAWNTFTTLPDTNKLVNTSFWYYRYSTELDKVTVARVLMVEGDYTTVHPKYWPVTVVSTPGAPVVSSPKFQFENGGFENGTLSNSTTTAAITGWTIYKSEVRFGGVSNILGFPTPTDPTPTPTGSGNRISPGDNAAINKMTFTVSLASDSPPIGSSKKSLRLISNGSTNTAYAVVRGPYAVNNNAVDLAVDDTIEFWWKAQGGSDAYDIFAYLLNTTTGQTITLLNDTGKSTSATTKWAKESRKIVAGEEGQYKFIFVSGTFDYTGGKVLGASLYIDEVNVIKAQTTTVTTTSSTSIPSVVDITTKYLKFTGPGQWPWTPNRGVLE